MSTPITKLTAGNLAALLCARICHDLVSPIGALSTALEVFDDDQNLDMRDDALDLIKLSARQASAKLQFLRLAFGSGGSAPGIIASAELRKLIMGVYGEGKAELVWGVETVAFDKSSARLFLNLIMLAVNTVPRGGTITLKAVRSPEQTNISMVATGPKARLVDSVTHTLAGGAPEDGFDGRSVQPFYTGMIAREAGGQIRAAIEGETVTFTAQMPSESFADTV